MLSKPWLKRYAADMPPTLKPYPECTLLDYVRETVRQKPDHTAMIFKGRRITVAELERHSDAFAAALVAQGVARGDRVAVLLPNSPQAVIAQLGVWKAGAITCPLNPLYTVHELTYALKEIAAETVVTLTPFYTKIKEVQPRTGVKRVIASNVKDFLSPALRLLFTLLKEKKEGHRVELQPGDLSMNALLHDYAGQRPDVAVGPQDPAILLFSGGTTGTPKAALGTHQAMVMTSLQMHAYARQIMPDWEGVITLVMPLFHVYGNMALCTSLVARWPMAIVVNPRDLDDLLKVIRTERPGMLHGVPTLFTALLAHPQVLAGKADLSSLKICFSAAAPLMAELKVRFERQTGARLLEAYGMTETMLAPVVCPPDDVYKVGSAGIPLPDVEIRIVDEETGQRDLGFNEPGEVIIRAPQIMLGYWNRPDETAQMVRDGWVYTGDIGSMDEDGYLFIVDRKKDVIKPGGFQVWPREVEEVIATHPAVADVCVAGIPDPMQGEAVKAWVILRPDLKVTPEELQTFCRQKLAAYKIPRHVEFRPSLPKTMVGKTLRRVLVSEETTS